MKLRLSARAASDLRQILDYLDTQNPRAAKSVRFSIRRAFDIITSFPANRSCANTRHSQVRRPAISLSDLLFSRSEPVREQFDSLEQFVIQESDLILEAADVDARESRALRPKPVALSQRSDRRGMGACGAADPAS